MSIVAQDDFIVRWAEHHRLRYYCIPAQSAEPGFLRVHLGHVTADFSGGKLLRLSVQSDGRSLDDAFCELTSLFDLCRQAGAYLRAEDGVSEAEKRGLYG